MRITITQVAGVSDGAGHRYTLGSTVDVDEQLGRAWVAAGHAVPADEPAPSGPTEEPPKPKRGKRTATKPPAESRGDDTE